MNLNWESFFIIFGIAQAVFLSILLLSSRKTPTSGIFFGLLLLVEAIGLFEQFTYFSGIVHQSPHLLGLSYPFNILRPALLFFFVLSYFKKDFKLKPKDSIHLIPFALSLLLFMPLLISSSTEKLEYLRFIQGSVWTDSTQGIVFFIVNNLIYSAYLVYSIRIVQKNLDALIQIKDKGSIWVGRLVMFFAIFFLLRIGLYLLNGFHFLSSEDIGTTVLLISSFTIQVIAWFLLKGSKLPRFNAAEIPKDIEIERLTTALDIDKVFLDDTLSLEKLSHIVGVPLDRLSTLFRMHYGRSFKEIINSKRVIEAKKLIDQQGPEGLNLLAIALESGFNNKVTFYRAFKKNEDTSPSEYVKMKFSSTFIEHSS